jgi:protein SCO1/2
MTVRSRLQALQAVAGIRLPTAGAWIALCMLLWGLSGCGKSAAPEVGGAVKATSATPVFRHVDITGAPYAQALAGLADPQGQTRSLADWRGKAVLVFFGYTRCPDVCPTTLQEAAQVAQLLGPQADRFQVVFVTLDPARDTPDVLEAYVKSFNPNFLALRGDDASTRQVAQHFKVFFERVEGKSPGNETFDHTAASFIFDPEGRVRLYVRGGQGPEALAHDVRQMLL